jgi:hypothetical protein
MNSIAAFVAYGEKSDLSGGDWLIVLVDGAILLIACVLVAVPALLAERRRHSNQEAILSGALLWGVIGAWNAISFVNAEFKWSRERLLLVQSGYFDPQNTSSAPPMPILLWAVLGVCYGLLMLWSLSGKRTVSRGASPGA